MTQQEKLRKATMFAMKMKSLASRLMSEGNDYDMSWHKKYANDIQKGAEEILKMK